MKNGMFIVGAIVAGAVVVAKNTHRAIKAGRNERQIIKNQERLDILAIQIAQHEVAKRLDKGEYSTINEVMNDFKFQEIIAHEWD